MSKATPATLALTRQGLGFELRSYDYDPDAPRAAASSWLAAEALGEPPGRVLKTLIAEVDGRPVCIVVPSDREVSMKKVAATFGGKAAKMMPPPDAERLTGYKVGGVASSASGAGCRSWRRAPLPRLMSMSMAASGGATADQPAGADRGGGGGEGGLGDRLIDEAVHQPARRSAGGRRRSPAAGRTSGDIRG